MVTDDACSSLASALKSNPSHLRELDLSYNHPGESGVKLLSDLLEDPHCALEKLQVDHGGKIRMKLGVEKYAVGLTLDPNTVNRRLSLSEGNRKVEQVDEDQPRGRESVSLSACVRVCYANSAPCFVLSRSRAPGSSCEFVTPGVLLRKTHTMAGRGRGQDTFNVFSPLVGRGRALHMSDETIGLPRGLQLTRDSPLGSRGTPRNVPAMPTCSTPRDNNSDVTQQLRELIGELVSQIGETIASRILANQSPVTTTPLAPPCNRETESLNNSLDLSKMSVVVRSDIKEPPMFRGDDSDKYTVQEWIDVMELYLHKSSCPDTERSNTILSHLLGRAKNIVKVGLKSSSAPNTVVSSEKIYDVLKRYFSDSPVSSLPLADFYATRPKDKESPVDYWVRLNATAERAANYLQQNGGKMENINAEIAMMFIRNCNSPDLSSVFKCKPMIKWSIEEVQEAIDEY
ncbi:hypothetical protein SRHO_G00032830 [Serrasalmus rhombeus]